MHNRMSNDSQQVAIVAKTSGLSLPKKIYRNVPHVSYDDPRFETPSPSLEISLLDSPR